jgi:hypothetical protein
MAMMDTRNRSSKSSRSLISAIAQGGSGGHGVCGVDMPCTSWVIIMVGALIMVYSMLIHSLLAI